MLEKIKKDVLAAVTAANKRDLKILRDNFNKLNQDEVKEARQLLDIEEISDAEKELLMFFIKGKPTLKLKTNFDTFQSYRRFLSKKKISM